MYLYIYDTFLNNNPRYAVVLEKIQQRLLDLGINGRVEKLSVLKSLQELVKGGKRAGAKTIVAIGGDKLLTQLLHITPNFPDITVGYIPIEEKSILAQIFGIPQAEKACDILSSRIIKIIDAAKVNGKYFFASLESPEHAFSISCDDQFRLSFQPDTKKVVIANLGSILTGTANPSQSLRDPHDGFLEILTESSKNQGLGNWFRRSGKSSSSESVIHGKKLKVESGSSPIAWLADGQEVIKTPFQVEIMPQQLKIIVGKERMFT